MKVIYSNLASYIQYSSTLLALDHKLAISYSFVVSLTILSLFHNAKKKVQNNSMEEASSPR